MKCFIHLFDEAISVCKQCGKAMCMNCSAYSDHSGICPECRRNEFINEHNLLNRKIKNLKKSAVISIVLAVLFAVAAIIFTICVGAFCLIVLIGTLIFAIRAIILFNKCSPLNERMEYLAGEIRKLNTLLQRGKAII